MSNASPFLIQRLRSKPVEYTVTIRHFVADGDWVMSVCVQDVSDDDINKLRVADDLKRAAAMIIEDTTEEEILAYIDATSEE